MLFLIPLAGLLIIGLFLPLLFWITKKVEQISNSDSDWYSHLEELDSDD